MPHVELDLQPLRQVCRVDGDEIYSLREQVGINKRIMVFNPEGDKKKWLQVLISRPFLDATDCLR